MRKLRVEPVAAHSMPPSILHLLLLIAGVWSILLLLPSIRGLELNLGRVLLLTAILCVILWLFRRFSVLGGAALVVLCASLCARYAYTHWNDIITQGIFLYELVVGERSSAAVPDLLLVFSICWTLLLFSWELLLSFHMVPYLLTTAAVLALPAAGVRPSMEAVLCTVAYQTIFWPLHTVNAGADVSRTVPRKRLGVSVKCGIAAAAFLLVALLLAVPFSGSGADMIYDAAYQVEGAASRTVRRSLGSDTRTTANGSVARGNQYYTETRQLTVALSDYPEEPLYLSGFHGGTYDGGVWQAADEAAVFERIAESISRNEDFSNPSMAALIRSAVWDGSSGMNYYLLNYLSGQEDEQLQRTVLITREQPDQFELPVQEFSPYYELKLLESLTMERGNNEEKLLGSIYFYYEQKDMALDWDVIGAAGDERQSWRPYISRFCRWLQDEYVSEIQNPYTAVSKDAVPRLAKLCADHPMESPEEITAFILHTLRSRCEYTLTPGWTPVGTDPVEYFLFENGLGYCQHFAAAATLMYRLYGIPARYVTGYRVDPSQVEELSDPSLEEPVLFRDMNQIIGLGGPPLVCGATVTDADAHAWVELFLEDCGWTPVEVTPSANGVFRTDFPGLDNRRITELLTAYRTEELRDLFEAKPTASSDERESLTLDHLRSIGWHAGSDELRALLSALICFLLLVPLFLDFRRIRRLERIERMGCREIYDHLCALLHFAGINTAPEEGLPGISQGELLQYLAALESAAFGPDGDSPEERNFARKLYRRTASQVYAEQSPIKKLLFRIVYVLG